MASTPFAQSAERWSPSAGATSPEPGSASLRLFGFECSLATTRLDTLERVSQSLSRGEVARRFARATGTEEAALLQTCHRVELVVLVRSPADGERWGDSLPGPPGAWRSREGRSVVRHLYRVASGRESLAVGEGEVRHQVRAAAVASRYPRPILRGLFVGAAAAADRLQPVVPSYRSIAAIAAEELLRRAPRPRPRVLVVGSGTVGRQVAERLAPRAEVTLAYHRCPPDPAFLTRTGSRAVPLETLATELAEVDAVVTAAKFGHRGLRAADLPTGRPLVLVDLGMPRNIDPEVRERPDVRLIDLEELHAGAPGLVAATPDDASLDALADDCAHRLARRLEEPWVDTVRRAAEAVRRSELATARRFLGPLDPAQEVAVERLSRRLVDRLLLAPTERIRSLPPGPDGDARRRFAAELLSPDPDGP